MYVRLCFAVLISATVFAQSPRLHFTTRTHLRCPISMSGILPSKEFGFQSVVFHNDTGKPIDELKLNVIAASATGEDVVESIALSVKLAPWQSKRIDVALGRVQTLTPLQPASVILVVASADFSDRSHWAAEEPVIYDPVFFKK